MSHEPTRLAADDRVGTGFGEYRIESLIGVGGMGKVYKATAGDGTTVALKVVKADLARDETFRRRFRREARIAQTVRNPHVVPVRDTGEHDGLPYLAAQLIEGVALDHKLELQGRLDLVTTVRICAQVAEGLQALWKAGMVHRDVKPANILLDLSGTAYITDFGLAKDSAGTVLTRPGQPLGSMAYMSPEQIRGEPVTGAADIYSLGCVVFECVYGRPPFADRPGLGVLWAHLQEEPPDLSAQRAGISPEFTRALNAALRKAPAERPRSSIEYARSLADAAGVPIVNAAS
ncbi:MAG: serine/threonine-protein kinase [Solirubrobacteraceae bacterium]